MSGAAAGKFVVKGTVTEICRGGNIRVELENGHAILAYPAGKLRQNRITCILNDVVDVELDGYSLDRGRIVYRYRD